LAQLQRIGRTGRKKDGDIAVLVAEGKEETNFEKAKEAYNMVQNSITKGDHIELYTDVPRLLPSNVHPQPHEMVMPIVGYKREASTTRASKSMGSIEKYVTRTRLPKEPKLTAKERKKMLAEATALANADSDESESLDLDVTKTKGKGKMSNVKEKSPSKPRKSRKKAGEAVAAPSDEELIAETRKKRRKKVDPSSSSDGEPPPKASKKSVKKKDIEGDSGPSRRKPKKERKTAVKRAREDNSLSPDNSPPRKKKKSVSPIESHRLSSPDVPPGPKFPTSPTHGFVSGTGRKLVAGIAFTAAIDISSDDEDLCAQNAHSGVNPEPLSPSSSGDEVNICEDDASLAARTRPGPSPPAIQVEAREDFMRNRLFAPSTSLSSIHYSPAPSQARNNSWHRSTSHMPQGLAGAHDWLLDSDSDSAPVISKSSNTFKQSPPNSQTPRGQLESLNSHSVASPVVKPFRPHGASERESFTEKLIPNMEPPGSSTKSTLAFFDLSDTSIELLPNIGQNKRNDAGSFRQPHGPEVISPFVTHAKLPLSLPAQSSSPIRPPGRIKRDKKSIKAALAHTLSSEVEEEHYSGYDDSDASHDNPILAHKYTTENKKHRRRPVYDRNNEFVAIEADLSGEDAAGGSTDTEGEEDQYDRAFIADDDVTQHVDYDQTAMYLQGLQTQAPAGFNFANRPVRVGVFGQGFSKSSRRPAYLSSSPPRKLDSEDAYEFGSFVVEDEAMEEDE
jgi:hypothetical protein